MVYYKYNLLTKISEIKINNRDLVWLIPADYVTSAPFKPKLIKPIGGDLEPMIGIVYVGVLKKITYLGYFCNSFVGLHFRIYFYLSRALSMLSFFFAT